MAKLFGFSIDDNEKQSPTIVSPVPPNNEDGNDNYIASGFYGSYVDTEGVYLYLCTPHAGLGMIGIVIVGDSLDNLDAVKKHRLMGKSKRKLKKILKEI